MQIKVEDVSKVKKKIFFEIPAARVADEIEKVYDRIRKKAAIKGFRKGKVPQAYLEKYFSEQMEADVLKNLVNDTYFKVLMDEKIFPVAHPVIETDELKKGEPFTYSATVEVFPEVEVKNYLDLEVKKETFSSSPDVVETRLKEMQESVAQMKPVEGRLAQLGDFVTIDFIGFIDGVPFDNGAAEDFVLELGSGRFIPGFEDQVAGMSGGEQKEITVTFPENYSSAEFANKTATFKVTVKEIKSKELPELDDDFAKEFGEFDTIADLRAKLLELHEKREHERIDADLKDRIVRALIERNPLEIPDSLIAKQLEGMLESTKKRLAMQRASLEMMGLDEEQYRERFRDVAESQVKGALLLEALAKQEGISATEEDLDAKFAHIAEQSGQNPEKVKMYYQQNDQAAESITSQVREDKVIEFLLQKARVSEVPREEL